MSSDKHHRILRYTLDSPFLSGAHDPFTPAANAATNLSTARPQVAYCIN